MSLSPTSPHDYSMERSPRAPSCPASIDVQSESFVPVIVRILCPLIVRLLCSSDRLNPCSSESAIVRVLCSGDQTSCLLSSSCHQSLRTCSSKESAASNEISPRGVRLNRPPSNVAFSSASPFVWNRCSASSLCQSLLSSHKVSAPLKIV